MKETEAEASWRKKEGNERKKWRLEWWNGIIRELKIGRLKKRKENLKLMKGDVERMVEGKQRARK